MSAVDSSITIKWWLLWLPILLAFGRAIGQSCTCSLRSTVADYISAFKSDLESILLVIFASKNLAKVPKAFD